MCGRAAHLESMASPKSSKCAVEQPPGASEVRLSFKHTSRVHRNVIMLNTRLSEHVFLKLQSHRMEPRWN